MSYEDYLEDEISSHEDEFEDEREMRQAYREAILDSDSYYSGVKISRLQRAKVLTANLLFIKSSRT